MPRQNAFGVSPDIQAFVASWADFAVGDNAGRAFGMRQGNAENDVSISQVGGRLRRDHGRIFQRRNAIPAYAAPAHLIQADRGFRSVSKIITETGVDGLIKPGLEFRIVRMGYWFLGPNPGIDEVGIAYLNARNCH